MRIEWNRETSEELARLLAMRCTCDLPLICGRCRRVEDIENDRPFIYTNFALLDLARESAARDTQQGPEISAEPDADALADMKKLAGVE